MVALVQIWNRDNCRCSKGSQQKMNRNMESLHSVFCIIGFDK